MKCLITGLDGQAATDLLRMLTLLEVTVGHSWTRVDDADMVFCNADSMPAPTGQAATGAKIVVVGTDATEEAWLSALESGAADYLPLPCQLAELRWILQSHFGRPTVPLAESLPAK